MDYITDIGVPSGPLKLSILNFVTLSEGFEPPMHCCTTVFKTARLPIITTQQNHITRNMHRPRTVRLCITSKLGPPSVLRLTVGLPSSQLVISKTLHNVWFLIPQYSFDTISQLNLPCKRQCLSYNLLTHEE